MLSVLIADERYVGGMDGEARIVPALLFQPHFGNISYKLIADEKGRTLLFSQEYEDIRTSPMFRGFKYIKTVAPLRRPTTGYAAGVRYMDNRVREGIKDHKNKFTMIRDEVTRRILNRSFMVDWQDRLLKDSILARFEDAKLNPTATFIALAAFLDIPYTESMTYCSAQGERDPETLKGDARGFDLRTVYETYNDYANDMERYFIEYFMRDVYEAYGYDFHYYDRTPVDEEKAMELVDGFGTIDYYIRDSWRVSLGKLFDEIKVEGGTLVEEALTPENLEKTIQNEVESFHKNRIKVTKILLSGLHFVNRNGQPLRMMPKLELDPSLLEHPLYR